MLLAECSWCPSVWLWQLEVVGTHVFGSGTCTWLVVTRVWRWHLGVAACPRVAVAIGRA